MINVYVNGYESRFDYRDTPDNRMRVIWEIATKRLSPVKYEFDFKTYRWLVGFEDGEEWEVRLKGAHRIDGVLQNYSIEIARTEGLE